MYQVQYVLACVFTMVPPSYFQIFQLACHPHASCFRAHGGWTFLPGADTFTTTARERWAVCKTYA